MSGRKVAVTGRGVASALGVGWQEFAAAAREGRSGLGVVTGFDVEGLGCEQAAEMTRFDVAPFLRSPKNFLDRNSQLAFAACELAARDSGLALPPADPGLAGLALGTGLGNLATLAMFREAVAAKGPKLAPPFVFPHTYLNTTASLLSIEYGLGGPHQCFVSGAAAGAQALAWAWRAIIGGHSGPIMAGGVDALCEAAYRGARACGWLSPCGPGPEGCRPFGADRNGTVFGEGAALFTLESAEAAKARGAGAKAWLSAAATGATAGETMGRALGLAVGAKIDLVAAAAGGYGRMDEEEREGLAEAGLSGIPLAAPKAALGETFGASGPLALAFAVALIESGQAGCALVNAGHPDGGAWVSLVLEAPGA